MPETTTQAPPTTPELAEPSVARTWRLDADHTEIGFRVRHMMVSWMKGRFRSFHGSVSLDDVRPERSTIDVEVDAASIDTRLGPRDDHLRSAEFLDVANHPVLTFRSTRVTCTGEDLDVAGDLTIRGVTREVLLRVTGVTAPQADPWGDVRRGASATARIHRKDWGLVWNSLLEGGGVLVGDDVVIELEVELIEVRREVGRAA